MTENLIFFKSKTVKKKHIWLQPKKFVNLYSLFMQKIRMFGFQNLYANLYDLLHLRTNFQSKIL
jgi:hypothetical protein